MSYALPPFHFDRYRVVVDAVNEDGLEWETFLARCSDAGYSIIEEHRDENYVRIGIEEGELEQGAL